MIGHVSRRRAPSTTDQSRARTGVPATQDTPEELEEITGHPEKPKWVPEKVSFIARLVEDWEWQVFESKVDAPIQENIETSFKQLQEHVQVHTREKHSVCN